MVLIYNNARSENYKRTVRERSEYSMTVLSTGSARESRKSEKIQDINYFPTISFWKCMDLKKLFPLSFMKQYFLLEKFKNKLYCGKKIHLCMYLLHATLKRSRRKHIFRSWLNSRQREIEARKWGHPRFFCCSSWDG